METDKGLFRYRMYIDRHGVLRMITNDEKYPYVKSIDISNMLIHGLYVTESLDLGISGSGNFDRKRNKVLFTDK